MTHLTPNENKKEVSLYSKFFDSTLEDQWYERITTELQIQDKVNRDVWSSMFKIRSNLKARIYFFFHQTGGGPVRARAQSRIKKTKFGPIQALSVRFPTLNISELMSIFLGWNLKQKEKQFLTYFFVIGSNGSKNLYQCTQSDYIISSEDMVQGEISPLTCKDQA